MDGLFNSFSKLDKLKLFAVGIGVGEKLPSDMDEGEGWTDGKEMIEEVHRFEEARSPRLFGEVIFDDSEGKRRGKTESECHFCFPTGYFYAEVIDLDFVPSDRTTWKMSDMNPKEELPS